MNKVSIIGAGIAGLTLALALERQGMEAEIFEAAPRFEDVGSGLHLAQNAMKIYEFLGIYEEVLRAGNYTNLMLICDLKFKPLSVSDLRFFERKYKVKSVAIHRAKLHRVLRKSLIRTPVYTGKKLVAIRKQNKHFRLQFADGTVHRTNMLIGADGIHSQVREFIFPNIPLRRAYQVCWRGIADIQLPENFHEKLYELWGKGKRFGFVSVGEKQCYWYALGNYKKDYRKEYENVELLDFFRNFPPIIHGILKATRKEKIITTEIADIKPLKSWHRENVCLIGDAAHATTPNLGQGACQAVESAWVLSRCLRKIPNVEQAFATYEKIRKPKTRKIIRTSWQIGKMAQLENNFAIFLRNSLMKAVPSKLTTYQTAYIYKPDGCK